MADDAYEWTVAHEMGHVFGIDDAYSDPTKLNWFEKWWDKLWGITQRPDAVRIVGKNDIMRYQFNGINISRYDIEMLLQAYSSGDFQSYFNYTGHKRSVCID